MSALLFEQATVPALLWQAAERTIDALWTLGCALETFSREECRIYFRKVPLNGCCNDPTATHEVWCRSRLRHRHPATLARRHNPTDHRVPATLC
jgi:hypothetical protein